MLKYIFNLILIGQVQQTKFFPPLKKSDNLRLESAVHSWKFYHIFLIDMYWKMVIHGNDS